MRQHTPAPGSMRQSTSEHTGEDLAEEAPCLRIALFHLSERAKDALDNCFDHHNGLVRDPVFAVERQVV